MTARRDHEAGFTLIEMVVAAALMTAIVGAVFALANPTQGSFLAQQEASDLQQRLRAAVSTLATDLRTAGAWEGGSGRGRSVLDVTAPIMPYRIGGSRHGPANGVFVRADAVGLLWVPSVPERDPDETQMRLGRDGILSSGPADTETTPVIARTYYLGDGPDGGRQLRRSDGTGPDVPVVDHVVALSLQFMGEGAAPSLRPPVEGEEARRTTYGPAPPAPDDDRAADAWGPGESCLFAIRDGEQVPRLPAIGPPGSLVALTPASMSDGPWCPDDASPQRYDADLLRVRRVRVVVRVAAAAAALRGPAGALFTRGGTAGWAAAFVPDLEVSFDIAPRNMRTRR